MPAGREHFLSGQDMRPRSLKLSKVKQSMNRTRRIALAWMLLSSGIFILWGSVLERNSAGGMADFKAVYYGARCLFQHSDPYKEAEFLRVYRADGWELPSDPVMSHLFHRAVPVCINLPASLFLISPLALLAWGPAHLLWMILLAGSLMLAAYLMWDSSASYASGVALLLICILLANSEILFSGGNLAGIAVSLCVVAVWCFLKERFLPVGILCLAVSLAIKPHDAGLVWLYFLLAGGAYRKRALQTLLITALLSLPAILWVSSVAPQWMPELRSNLSTTSAHGDLRDPGPASINIRDPERVIDLQTVVSLFRDDPRIYNPVSYLVCGALLAVWSIHTIRSSFSTANAWFALAAIVPLSMLATYHRPYDAKLLLLTIPACAMLWAEGGWIGKIALLANSAAILFTGDIPLALLVSLTKDVHMGTGGIARQIITVMLLRPVPLILLAMGIFYLWVYMRRTVPDKASP
jgi:hypothetical protein